MRTVKTGYCRSWDSRHPNLPFGISFPNCQHRRLLQQLQINSVFHIFPGIFPGYLDNSSGIGTSIVTHASSLTLTGGGLGPLLHSCG
jgi:hypothetical protein